ncbi:MAG: hypothetical protein JRJ86_22975, partial [Deltaproteobacteria bacterium]|nr:hypothetical protein [Deltaproteobacteria bacterium]
VLKQKNGAGVDLTNIKIVQDEITKCLSGECAAAKITGFCFFTSRDVWDLVGPFDEEIPAGGNEGEWIIRARAKGLFPWIDTRTYVHHYGNASYKKLDSKGLWAKGKDVILRKHGQKQLDWLEKEMYLDIYQEIRLIIER